MSDLFDSLQPKFKQKPLDTIYSVLHKYTLSAEKADPLCILKQEKELLQVLYESRPSIDDIKLLKNYEHQIAALQKFAKVAADAQTDESISNEALLNADKLLANLVKTIGTIRNIPVIAPSEYISHKECAQYPNIAHMIIIKEAMKPLSDRPIDQLPHDFTHVLVCAKKAKFLARLFVEVRDLTGCNGSYKSLDEEKFSRITDALNEYGLAESLAMPMEALRSACSSNDRKEIIKACKIILPILEDEAKQTAVSMATAYNEDSHAMSTAQRDGDWHYDASEDQHPLLRIVHRMRWEQAADAVGTALDPIAYKRGMDAVSQASLRA